MEATRCLRDEHEVILKVLDCFEIALGQAAESGRATREQFDPFVEFFQGFADKCHHCKEEDRLFPNMEKQGVPREGGPIGVMIHEHRQGRIHVRTIAEYLDAADGGDTGAWRMVMEHGQQFLDLLRNHIHKEDGVLFSMADQLIRGDDLTALNNAYSEAESAPAYCETLNRCRAVADQLVNQYL